MAKIHAIHRSIWREKKELEQTFDELTGTHSSDVAIIGAGITGLSLALECLQRGMSVAVYEASVIGAGTSGASTGHVESVPEMGTSELIKKLGLEAAQKYVQLRRSAIDKIESRANGECDFVRIPGFYYSENIEDEDSIRSQLHAAKQLLLDAQIPDSLPALHVATAYKINAMARMNSLAYIGRLAKMVTEAGGKIFEQTMFTKTKDDDPKQAQCGAGLAMFSQLVSCAHYNQTASTKIDFQIPAYQSYALVAKVRNAFPDILMWDNANPYFYTRRLESGDDERIIVGGCDHRTGAGDPLNAISDLREYLFERFEVDRIESEWSAELFEPTDGLPLIGKAPGEENLWVATGFSGVGLTLGTVAAEMIAKQIAGEQAELSKELSPSRFSIGELGNLIVEQSKTIADVAKRVLPASAVNAESLPPGEGQVGNYQGEHAAVCRDREGNIHARSPICTHMGGVVRWNPFEQTWDCPVHGGRFTQCGMRIYGPPKMPLKNLDERT